MHADLEKLLSLGKINPVLAEKLDKMSPGRYCCHASWGAGKVVSWSLVAKKLVINFEKEPDHEVALEFAPRILEFIADDHFLAKRYEDAPALIEMASEDPVELVKTVLKGYGNSLTPEKLEAALKGIIIKDFEWKKWWDRVRAMLRTDVQFMMPTRKGERIILRANALTRAAAALEDYTKATDLKAKVRILDAVKKDAFADEQETLVKLIAAVDDDVRSGGSLALLHVLELAVLRDEMVAALKGMEAPADLYALSDIVELHSEDLKAFAQEVNLMPATRQKAVYMTLPTVFGDAWLEKALNLFEVGGARSVGEIAKFLIEQGHKKELIDHLNYALVRQNLPAESLVWICRQRKDAAAEVFNLSVGVAMLNMIEQYHLDGVTEAQATKNRLKNLFIEDVGDRSTKDPKKFGIIGALVYGRDAAEVRQFAKLMYGNSAFTEQERGALMARVMRHFPDMHSIVMDAMSSKGKDEGPEPLFVSWESLDARKKELEELVNVKIPENKKNKAISRAEGDLRENGGYQDAKEVEKVLNRRRAELEHMLSLARGTDFAVTDTSTVAMGMKVTLAPIDGGQEVVYTILGAWDLDIEKHIVSYLSQVGQELTGKAVGDQVKIVPMDDENGRKKIYTITKIEPAF